MNNKTSKNTEQAKVTDGQGEGIPKKRGARLRTLADCKRFLSRIINELNRKIIEPDRARAFGYLMAILTSIIKDSDFEMRLDNLEKQWEEIENEKH